MARQVKCPYCEDTLDKDEAHSYKKRYYHQECFETWQQESEHRNSLIEYIMELYNLDAPTGMMLKQVKDFKEQYNYQYKGMELTLRFFHETMGRSVLEDSGIGIIPYYYEKAKKHHIMKMKVQESLENHEEKQRKTVEVYSPKHSYKKKVEQIDISSL